MQLTVFRIVVAAPGDVQPERSVLPRVIKELNDGIAAERDLTLQLWQWDTDAYPGFHPEGQQVVIDRQMKIEDCDILIGIFWKRFGTPVRDAGSGTEHEFKLAYQSWREAGRPQIFFYFKDKPYHAKRPEETRQWTQVLEFRDSFPQEGLWRYYTTKADFEALVRKNLSDYIRALPRPDAPRPPAEPGTPAGARGVAPPEPAAPAGARPRALVKTWHVAVAALLAAAALAFLLWPRERDCGDIRTASCLKLDLATGANQEKCFPEGRVELTEADIGKLQKLAGKAILPIPAQENGCPCEWRWGTDKSALERGPSGSSCIFSFDLPDGVEYILLNLIVDEQLKVFTIHVRKNKEA
jgi:hypothetical protein